MRCDDLQGLLAGLVAGDLSPAQEEFLRLHLQSCPHCQTSYTGLLRTRRQLEGLTDESYQPRLTGRITRAIARSRGRRAILIGAGRGLRAAGALLTLGLVVALLLWQQWPLQQAAAPPPAGPVYLVAGRDLLRVDAPGQEPHRAARLPEGAELWPTGLLRFGSVLNLIHLPSQSGLPPAGARVTDSLPAGTRHLVGDGRTVWLVRQEGSAFAVDRLLLETGRLVPDPAPKEGQVYRAALSADRSALYLLARTGGSLYYVKVVDPASGALRSAHLLPEGVGPGALLLPDPLPGLLHLVDQGRLLTLDLERGAILLDLQIPGLTTVAALSPDGSRLLSARPDGGLLLVERATGKILRQRSGHRYRQLLWQEGWVHALGAGTLDLVDPQRLRVRASTPVPAEATALQLPDA
ncbi:MAG: anti-sigma factor family protein [Bacillota bacterium]